MSKTKRIFIRTFGCQMNEYDTERLYRLASLEGYQRTETPGQADLIVVNTCSVRDKPEHKAVSEIGWMHKRERKDKNVKIVMAGCVAQQLGNQLLAKFPYLDLVLGTGAVDRFPELICRMEKGERMADCRIDAGSMDGMPDRGDRQIESQGVSAFVSIMRGCNNFCSYCIVPFVRGPEESRPSVNILREIQSLVNQGVREVTLLGQNVNSYGAKSDETMDFVGLLDRVHEIDGLVRIRFTTSHPKDLSPRLIEAFGRLPKLAGHLHLAVQSGSDRILEKMNRRYTSDHIRNLVRILRTTCPEISITSDIIVGFCTETDDDFLRTMELLETIRFDNLFSFMYSPRPRTLASKWPDDVPLEVKKERLAGLQAAQKNITLEKNQEMVGKKSVVLVEGNSRGGPHRVFGRTECFRVTHFDDESARPGDLVEVQILEGWQNALVGMPVKR